MREVAQGKESSGWHPERVDLALRKYGARLGSVHPYIRLLQPSKYEMEFRFHGRCLFHICTVLTSIYLLNRACLRISMRLCVQYYQHNGALTGLRMRTEPSPTLLRQYILNNHAAVNILNSLDLIFHKMYLDLHHPALGPFFTHWRGSSYHHLCR